MPTGGCSPSYPIKAVQSVSTACAARWRCRALDLNRWLQNVEVLVACNIGRETTQSQYVGRIFKYCVVSRLVIEQREARKSDRAQTIEKAGSR
jgi:hypothetical protein